MTLLLGCVVIAGGIYAVYRRVDVRLALLVTALVLGSLADKPMLIVRKFLETFSNERFVVPICTAMGFAYVLKLTQCDQHLVHLLINTLRHVRPLLVPGTVVVGFLVNIPIVSQTSTAITLGAVAIPVLLAAGVRPLTIGAALLLGSSIGGELLNPGAPELRTVVEDSDRAARALGCPLPGMTDALVARILPLNLLGLFVASAVFWTMTARSDGTAVPFPPSAAEAPVDFSVNVFKAMIPILPLVLLFLTAPPLQLIQVPPDWLVDAPERKGLTPALRGLFDCRLIGAAMLVGVLVAALSTPQSSLQVAGAFFEGAGYGFTHIVSLIVTATCFGEAVRLIGLAAVLGEVIERAPVILMPAAGMLPLAFGVLCGSGMASTQSLFGFFAQPALQLDTDPYLVGAIVALASAAGRTMSPFSAVTLMSATMTKTTALQLSARVALPLLAAVVAEVIAAMVAASWY
jgi:C4-dicarboxylate transporter, DcuC family